MYVSSIDFESKVKPFSSYISTRAQNASKIKFFERNTE